TALRTAAGAARSDPQIRAAIADIQALYKGRADCAGAIADMATHTGDVIDASDRLRIAETTLLGALDRDARRLVSAAVKRVSVVTAVSPVALLDVGFAALTYIGLIRGISRLYGGRPGFFGLLRLGRMVIAHLAVTGSLALGDQLVGQVIGHGLAARISARLGEGVLNGLLAARVGKAAIEMCRPMEFVAMPAPRVSELAAGIVVGQGPRPTTPAANS
ncbi:MAG: TIGR01620 family protein, partial [Hyphomicrobiales bacterium]